MYIHVHTCTHTYILHTCMHSIHIIMHTYIHMYIYTYINTCIRMYIHTYVHTYIRYCKKTPMIALHKSLRHITSEIQHSYFFTILTFKMFLYSYCSIFWIEQHFVVSLSSFWCVDCVLRVSVCVDKHATPKLTELSGVF